MPDLTDELLKEILNRLTMIETHMESCSNAARLFVGRVEAVDKVLEEGLPLARRSPEE